MLWDYKGVFLGMRRRYIGIIGWALYNSPAFYVKSPNYCPQVKAGRGWFPVIKTISNQGIRLVGFLGVSLSTSPSNTASRRCVMDRSSERMCSSSCRAASVSGGKPWKGRTRASSSFFSAKRARYASSSARTWGMVGDGVPMVDER